MTKKIVILGAGISGLSLGFFLKKQFKDNLDLTILEKNSSPGGYIKTITQEGFLFELGPRSFRTAGNGIKALQLIEELHIENEVIVADASAKNRYVYTNSKMEKLPNGVFSFLKSPLTKNSFKGIISDLFGNSKSLKDESIETFINRKFGRGISENLFDPLTSGIYAGDISKLSLKSCFPMFYELEKKHGSLIRGMILTKNRTKEHLSPFIQRVKKHSIFSFKNGMQTLTDALSKELKEHIVFSSEIATSDIKADFVLSTIPPHHLVHLISDRKLKDQLSEFHAASVAVVSLGFKKDVLKTKGFGYLIPSKEKEEILGCVFDSSVFKEQNRFQGETRLTVMIGGANMADFDSYSKDDFLEKALRAISKHLNINDKPCAFHVEIWKNAIPQYLIGHSERILKLNDLTPPHFKILGSSFHGVSVSDCIANSEKLAQLLRITE